MADENINTSVNEEQQQQQGAEENTKTYTQEEVLKLLLSETDKRVTQALATQQKKFDRQLSLSKLDA